MKIVPLGDRVIVKKLKMEMTAGGIFLPSGMQVRGTVGEIVAVGPGYLEDDASEDKEEKWTPLQVKVGQRVCFFENAGVPLSKDLRILKEREILAVESESKEAIDLGDITTL